MSHYVVLRTFDDGTDRHVHGLAYTTVPGGSNDAGTPWPEVVAGYATWRNRRYGGFGTQSVIPVDPVIQAQLDAGTLFEWRFDVTFPTSHTNPQAIAAIEAGIDAQEAAMVAELSATLRYWGHEADTV